MAKDKNENVDLDIKDKEPEILESDKKALEAFGEVLKDNGKKISSLEKEIKGVVDRIDSFDFDVEEELTKKEPEKEKKSEKKGYFIIFLILGVLIAWAFKDKLKNGIQQKNEVS